MLADAFVKTVGFDGRSGSGGVDPRCTGAREVCVASAASTSNVGSHRVALYTGAFEQADVRRGIELRLVVSRG